MLHVHIFDVGETNTSSNQQLIVCGANHIHVQYLSDMHYMIHVMYMHKVYHEHFTHLARVNKRSIVFVLQFFVCLL